MRLERRVTCAGVVDRYPQPTLTVQQERIANVLMMLGELVFSDLGDKVSPIDQRSRR